MTVVTKNKNLEESGMKLANMASSEDEQGRQYLYLDVALAVQDHSMQNCLSRVLGAYSSTPI